MIADLKSDIEKLVEPIFEKEGFELVDTKLSRFKNDYRLQLFADSDNGISLDECANLSRMAGAALDVADIFGSKYILEVSSPGVDRPLKTENDFRRKIGREIRVEYAVKGKRKRAHGTLITADATKIIINAKEGHCEIALIDIQKSNEVI